MEHMSRSQKRMMRQARSDMQGMLEQPFSRRYLMRLIQSTGVYANNHEVSGVAEGRRQVGIGIINEIMAHNPVAYASLMADAAKLAKQNDDRNQPNEDDEHDA